jgi:hypothetical protein
MFKNLHSDPIKVALGWLMRWQGGGNGDNGSTMHSAGGPLRVLMQREVPATTLFPRREVEQSRSPE